MVESERAAIWPASTKLWALMRRVTFSELSLFS